MEYTNVCKKCGAENTIWPIWKGKRVIKTCSECGQTGHGITKTEAQKRGLMKRPHLRSKKEVEAQIKRYEKRYAVTEAPQYKELILILEETLKTYPAA